MQASEKQRARGAYNWLRLSPLLTVITYSIVASMDIGSKLICGSSYDYECINASYSPVFLLTHLSALLGSALWHLILLQYISKKQPEFVQWHGGQAFVLASIRTLIPISFWLVDYIAQVDGCLYSLAIPVLILLWLQNTAWGLKQVERGECNLAKWLGRTISAAAGVEIKEPPQTSKTENLSASFNEVPPDVQSADVVT